MGGRVGRHGWLRLGLLALLLAMATASAPPAGRAAAHAATAAPRPVPQAERVRVGFLKVLGEAPMVLARERGYFAAEGIDVELVDFAVTADALPPLGTGQLDVITGGLNPAVFNAVARGVGVKIVADGGSVGPDNDYLALVVRRDLVDSGRYRTPADLRGLRIAVPGPYAVVHYVLKVLLDQQGLALADVDVVPLAMADHAGAVSRGAVDAAFTVEPFVTQAVRLGAVRVLGAHEVTPNLTGGITLYSPAFPARAPAVAERYMVAWLRGVADYNAAFGPERRDTDAAVQLLRDRGILVDPTTRLPGFRPDGRFDVEGMRGMLDWYVAEGVVPPGIDLATVVDFQYVDRAAQRLSARP
ncbi:MAG TPA: ABC transporter substrate-binding protein [Chloroflexota bacterium]|nr:ABC transporter substrate-binding protein [Chloroflexota bacterium]